MGKAPKPGSFDQTQARKQQKVRIMRITLCGSTLDLNMALHYKERFLVRTATGLPLSAFLGDESKIDEDSVKVLWWLARRQNGEPRLSFETVDDEWPEGLTEDDLEVEEITDDDDEETDDPESSGPA